MIQVMSLVVAIFALLSIVSTCSGAQQKSFDVVRCRSPELNHVVMTLGDGSEWAGALDIWYPPHAINVCLDGLTSCEDSVHYERCYELSGGEIPRDVWSARDDERRLVHVRSADSRGPNGAVIWARHGDVVLRFSGKGSSHDLWESLQFFVGEHEQVIHKAYTVRATVEQHVNGEWILLTRFRFGDGMGFWVAPQDTIRLRAQFAAFEVRYSVDAVRVDGYSADSSAGVAFHVERPSNGYWPFKPIQPFFREFRSATIEHGEAFEWEYEVISEPVVSNFSLDVRALFGDHDPQQMRLVLEIWGPSMSVPESPNELSDWPLEPSSLRTNSVVEDRGYPGGALLPRWAIDKLVDLAPWFGGWNEANDREYGEYIKMRIEEKKRESKR